MSKGGGGGGDQTTTVEPWSALAPYLKDFYKEIGTLQPQNYYPGQSFIPRTGTELTADQLRLGYAQDLMPGQIDQTQASWARNLNASDVANNPYVNNMLAANRGMVTDALTQDWLPATHMNAIGAGGYGGSGHAKAQQRALENASKQLGYANAQTQLGAYDSGLTAERAAQLFSPQMLQLSMAPADVYSQVGANQRADMQQGLDEDQLRWAQSQGKLGEYLAQKAGLLGGTSGQYTSTTTPGPQSSTAGNVLGGAGLGYAAAPMAYEAITGSALAAGATNPYLWPMVIGGGLLGGLFS